MARSRPLPKAISAMLIAAACAPPAAAPPGDAPGDTASDGPASPAATPDILDFIPLTERVSDCEAAAAARPHQLVCLRDGEAFWLDEALQLVLPLGPAAAVDAVATDHLPWVRLDDTLIEVDDRSLRPLDLGLPVPVTDMRRTGGTTWLSGAGRLFEVRGAAIVEVVVDATDVISAYAASETHLYLATPDLVVLRRDAGRFEVESMAPGPISDLAVDDTGMLWTLIDGTPSVWMEPGAGVPVSLPEPIIAFEPPGPWLIGARGAYQLQDRVLWHHTMDTTGVLGSDAEGRLLEATDGQLLRHSVGRPVVIPALPVPLEVTEEVLLLPSDPASVTALSVHVGDTPVEVLGDPWRARLDPERLEAGDGVLRIFMESELGDQLDQHNLWVGSLPDVTWADVEEINQASCLSCHGGDTATRLVTSDDWRIRIDAILEYVNSGEMPLGDDRLSDPDIVTIRAWKHGGFP
ncbi:MAG: cytochrome c [Myxococcota bacterium]|nr:cytochrome c [Myxococcota bacterium]